MDRGAWKAIVHWVAKNQTGLRSHTRYRELIQISLISIEVDRNVCVQTHGETCTDTLTHPLVLFLLRTLTDTPSHQGKSEWFWSCLFCGCRMHPPFNRKADCFCSTFHSYGGREILHTFTHAYPRPCSVFDVCQKPC